MANKNNIQYDIEKELNKMQQALQNNRNYGSFEMPRPNSKAEMMEQLQVKDLFQNLNEVFNESKAKANKIKTDKRYNPQYKQQYLNEEREKFQQEKQKTIYLAKARLQFWKEALKKELEPQKSDQEMLLDSINKNSLLLKMAMIQNLDKPNAALLEGLAKEAYKYDDVKGLVEESFKDDVTITKTFIEAEEEANAPYKDVDNLMHQLDIIQSNEDWQVDENFAETGSIGNFDKLDDIYGLE